MTTSTRTTYDPRSLQILLAPPDVHRYIHGANVVRNGFACGQFRVTYRPLTSLNGGTVTETSTYDYKNLRPTVGGLFCEMIFGRLHRKMKRRRQAGRIELPSPTMHAWFMKPRSHYAAILTNRKRRVVEGLVYGQVCVCHHRAPFASLGAEASEARRLHKAWTSDGDLRRHPLSDPPPEEPVADLQSHQIARLIHRPAVRRLAPLSATCGPRRRWDPDRCRRSHPWSSVGGLYGHRAYVRSQQSLQAQIWRQRPGGRDHLHPPVEPREAAHVDRNRTIAAFAGHPNAPENDPIVGLIRPNGRPVDRDARWAGGGRRWAGLYARLQWFAAARRTALSTAPSPIDRMRGLPNSTRGPGLRLRREQFDDVRQGLAAATVDGRSWWWGPLIGLDEHLRRGGRRHRSYDGCDRWSRAKRVRGGGLRRVNARRGYVIDAVRVPRRARGRVNPGVHTTAPTGRTPWQGKTHGRSGAGVHPAYDAYRRDQTQAWLRRQRLAHGRDGQPSLSQALAKAVFHSRPSVWPTRPSVWPTRPRYLDRPSVRRRAYARAYRAKRRMSMNVEARELRFIRDVRRSLRSHARRSEDLRGWSRPGSAQPEQSRTPPGVEAHRYTTQLSFRDRTTVGPSARSQVVLGTSVRNAYAGSRMGPSGLRTWSHANVTQRATSLRKPRPRNRESPARSGRGDGFVMGRTLDARVGRGHKPGQISASDRGSSTHRATTRIPGRQPGSKRARTVERWRLNPFGLSALAEWASVDLRGAPIRTIPDPLWPDLDNKFQWWHGDRIYYARRHFGFRFFRARLSYARVRRLNRQYDTVVPATRPTVVGGHDGSPVRRRDRTDPEDSPISTTPGNLGCNRDSRGSHGDVRHIRPTAQSARAGSVRTGYTPGIRCRLVWHRRSWHWSEPVDPLIIPIPAIRRSRGAAAPRRGGRTSPRTQARIPGRHRRDRGPGSRHRPRSSRRSPKIYGLLGRVLYRRYRRSRPTVRTWAFMNVGRRERGLRDMIRRAQYAALRPITLIPSVYVPANGTLVLRYTVPARRSIEAPAMPEIRVLEPRPPKITRGDLIRLNRRNRARKARWEQEDRERGVRWYVTWRTKRSRPVDWIALTYIRRYLVGFGRGLRSGGRVRPTDAITEPYARRPLVIVPVNLNPVPARVPSYDAGTGLTRIGSRARRILGPVGSPGGGRVSRRRLCGYDGSESLSVMVPLTPPVRRVGPGQRDGRRETRPQPFRLSLRRRDTRRRVRIRRSVPLRRRLRQRLKRSVQRHDAHRNDAANVAGTYVVSRRSKPVGPTIVKLGPRLYRPAPVRSAGVTRHHERLRPRHPLASSTYARRSRAGLAVWLNRQAFVARVTSTDPNKGCVIDVGTGFRTLTRFRSTGSVVGAGIPDVDRGPVVFARPFGTAVSWCRPFTSTVSNDGPCRSHGGSPRHRRCRPDPRRFGVIAHVTQLRSKREPNHVRRSRFGACTELTADGTRNQRRRSRCRHPVQNDGLRAHDGWWRIGPVYDGPRLGGLATLLAVQKPKRVLIRGVRRRIVDGVAVGLQRIAYIQSRLRRVRLDLGRLSQQAHFAYPGGDRLWRHYFGRLGPTRSGGRVYRLRPYGRRSIRGWAGLLRRLVPYSDADGRGSGSSPRKSPRRWRTDPVRKRAWRRDAVGRRRRRAYVKSHQRARHHVSTTPQVRGYLAEFHPDHAWCQPIPLSLYTPDDRTRRTRKRHHCRRAVRNLEHHVKSRVIPEFNRTGMLPDLYTLPDAGIVGVVHDWITPLPWPRDRVNATYLSQSLVYPTSASGSSVVQHGLDNLTHHSMSLRRVWNERLRSMEFAANLSNAAEVTLDNGDGSGSRRRFAVSQGYYGRRFRYDPFPADPRVPKTPAHSAYVTMNQALVTRPPGHTSNSVPANQTRADAWIAASRSSLNTTRFGILRDDIFAIPVRVPKNDRGIVPSYPDSSEVPADIYDAWYVMDLIYRKSQDWRKRGSRALRALRPFVATGARPGAMALQTLTVCPPDTRPMIELSPEQMAVSDLNKFYQRILIARKRQLSVYVLRGDFHRRAEPRGFTPGGRNYHYYSDRVDANPYERANQTRMQLALDNLIENGKGGGPPLTASNDRLLKSLSDNLKGKKGRFRQNLLGKRVDYSGRSVIVVGPTLRLHECGLPYDMGLVLYQNHLIRALVLRSRCTISYGRARTMVRERHGLALRMLRVLVEGRPLLLNRAPTLHRLGFQAFQPRLVSGRAILLHPLVCSAFNADFDGDQMAVHIPLTARSRSEAWSLMWSCNHQRSVATGEGLSLPSQDIVLGCYYLTSDDRLNRWKTLAGVRVAPDARRVLRSGSDVRPHVQPWTGRSQPRDVHRVIWVQTNRRLELGRNQVPFELQLHASGDVASLTPETRSVGRPGASVPNVSVKTTVGRCHAAHVTT